MGKVGFWGNGRKMKKSVDILSESCIIEQVTAELRGTEVARVAGNNLKKDEKSS